jgi:hypothetical protein
MTTRILVLVLAQCVVGCGANASRVSPRDVTTVRITEEAFQCGINTACELPGFVLAARQ